MSSAALDPMCSSALPLAQATPTRAKPLVDNRHDIRCCTLSPRHGSFTVDSASWFEELKRDPIHACSNMPLSVLLTGCTWHAASQSCTPLVLSHPLFGQVHAGVLSRDYRPLLHLCQRLIKMKLRYDRGMIEISLGLAFIFKLLAANDEEDAPSISPDTSWYSCVACAWQSLTTVGYGGVSTASWSTNIVCSTGVLLSLIFDAMGIGVFYQRMRHASPIRRKTALPSRIVKPPL